MNTFSFLENLKNSCLSTSFISLHTFIALHKCFFSCSVCVCLIFCFYISWNIKKIKICFFSCTFGKLHIMKVWIFRILNISVWFHVHISQKYHISYQFSSLESASWKSAEQSLLCTKLHFAYFFKLYLYSQHFVKLFLYSQHSVKLYL